MWIFWHYRKVSRCSSRCKGSSVKFIVMPWLVLPIVTLLDATSERLNLNWAPKNWYWIYSAINWGVYVSWRVSTWHEQRPNNPYSKLALLSGPPSLWAYCSTPDLRLWYNNSRLDCCDSGEWGDLTDVTLAIEETDKEDANEYEDDVLNMLC